MPNKTNDPAWPELLTPGVAWNVTVCPQANAKVIETDDRRTGDVVDHRMQVPRLAIATDHLVHQHELRHVLRNYRSGMWRPIGHRTRDNFRQMIEEVATEVENTAVGVDTRGCRDSLDWNTPHVSGEINAASWFLQLVHTCQGEHLAQRPEALQKFWATIIETLSDDRLADCTEVYEAICREYSDKAALEELADWLTAQFCKTEEPVEAPESMTMGGGSGESDDESEDDDADFADGSDDSDADFTGGESDDDSEPSESDDADAADGDESDDAADADDDGGLVGKTTDEGEPREPRPSPHFIEDHFVEAPSLPGESDETRRERADIEREAKEAEDAKSEAMRKSGEASRYEHLTGTSEFGKIDIHRHALDRRTSKQFGLSHIARDTGSQIRYPHRLYPTGRVFAVPAPGGSILVDNSGSMSWHQKTLEDAMERFPNLHCGVYSMHQQHLEGGRVRPFGGFVAKLCIVAQEGRLGTLPGKAANPGCDGHSYGNGDADKACLDYIIKHWPRPWVWVSDGQVEAETNGNYQHVDALMRRNKIPRVRTIEDAIAYLSGQAVQAWTTCYGQPQKMRRGGPFIVSESTPAPYSYSAPRSGYRRRYR